MIETLRLTIRPFEVVDAQEFLDLTRDEGFNAFPINIYRQRDLEGTREWLKNARGKFAVIEKTSGKLIGMGGLTPWKWEGEELTDITYRLRESAWGTGLGWELASALWEYGFGTLRLPVITATITPENLPSKKLAEKLGMKYDRMIELNNVLTELWRGCP